MTEPDSSFRERLRQAIAEHARAGPPQPLAEPRDSGRLDGVGDGSGPASAASTRGLIEELLGGAWHETDLGPAFVREEIYPLDHTHGRLALGSLLAASAEALGSVLRAGPTPAPEKLAFLDLETTGLSGGTGTYFFLAGLGTFADGGFRIRQYFLADLRHEPAMLSLLARDLSRVETLVTYNGRSFDLPCVDTRLVLARQPSPLGDLVHFDLLYAVRRLYRHRLPSCRLADAEEKLLGLERPDDLPGWMAPSVYFDYLQAGRIAPLRGVLRHNAEDILSTAALLAHLAELFDRRDLDARDAAALARWWEYAEDTERARRLYDAALPALEGGEDWRWAAARQACLLKRAGARHEAAALWTRLWAQGDRRAGLELAMHLEHQVRDFTSARDITRGLLAGAGEDERAPLDHRLRRLERKRARARGDGPCPGRTAAPIM